MSFVGQSILFVINLLGARTTLMLLCISVSATSFTPRDPFPVLEVAHLNQQHDRWSSTLTMTADRQQ